MLRPARLWFLDGRGAICCHGCRIPLQHVPPVPELEAMTYIEYCPPAGPMECRPGCDARRDMTPAECAAAWRYMLGVVTEAQDAADGSTTLVVIVERNKKGTP